MGSRQTDCISFSCQKKTKTPQYYLFCLPNKWYHFSFFIKVVFHIFHFSCVISFFYIKPQHRRLGKVSEAVVLYLSSTSNHNGALVWVVGGRLCYIFLLHQTTTVQGLRHLLQCCVISFFYIKPQLYTVVSIIPNSCVISFFYIKPQRESRFRW